MTLKKRGNVYHMIFQIDGVIVRESTKTADKRLAEQIHAKRKGELFSEVVVKGRKPIKCEAAIAAFLKSRRGTAGWASAEVKLRPFSCFSGRNLHDIKAHDVQEVIRKNQEATTIKTKDGVVRKKGNSANTRSQSRRGSACSSRTTTAQATSMCQSRLFMNSTIGTLRTRTRSSSRASPT